MSTPLRLRLPESVAAVDVATHRGSIPALEAKPDHPDVHPVIFLPGFTGSKEDFLEILEPCAQAGFRAIAVDLRGQYGSYTSNDPSEYDLPALADDVFALARELAGSGTPGTPHLVGHSFGGLVARTAALHEPGGLRSLTLMSAGPAALPEPGHRNSLLRQLLELLPTESLRSIYERKREIETSAGADLYEPAVEVFLRERFLAHCPTALRRMAEQLMSEPDRTPELAALADALPVHVVYGRDDDAWPPAEQADMARRLGARETVIPGARHSPAVEQPEATASMLVDFWRSV